MGEIVIKAEHLSKMYRLGTINNGTLWRDIQTWTALKMGKEDPHSKIGEDKFSGNEDFFWALKDLNFEIKQGDRVGIIGKNGAGKSTLLKILSRVTSPTEGIIKIKGKIASLLEVGTGFNGELTGRENVYLNGAILGMKKRQINRKIDEIISFSGIEHHIDTPVKRYSSGMYVRLAFAVAAHLDSEILIADEVLAVGDAEFQKKALGKMQDLSYGQGRTILFVSHNMGAVKQLCNTGMMLERGKIKYTSDSINELFSYYINDQPLEKIKYSWVNDNTIYDENFTPIKLSLGNEDGSLISSGLSADKRYLLNFEFSIDELVSNLTYGFVFSDLNGNIIFRTSPLDYIVDYKPKSGINQVSWLVPEKLLNASEYIISLFATIHNDRWIIHPENYTVSIRMNIVTTSVVSPYGLHDTLIAPKIEWRIETK